MKRTRILLLTALLIGCSSPNEPAPAPKPASKPERLKWAEMTHEQQETLMKEEVKPKMAAMFKAFDPEVYKKVGCKTCHGKNPKAVHFEMPSPDLPKLDPTDHFKAHKASDPKMTEFMMKKVTPAMVEILGVDPWSPKTPKGFGCFSCHTRKGG